MAGRTPIPVSRAMRTIAANLDLARRQQRITLDLLAERANLSVPTVRRLLNEGICSPSALTSLSLRFVAF